MSVKQLIKNWFDDRAVSGLEVRRELGNSSEGGLVMTFKSRSKAASLCALCGLAAGAFAQSLRVVAATGPVPAGWTPPGLPVEHRYIDLGFPSVNGAGDVVFFAGTATGPVDFPLDKRTGIWRAMSTVGRPSDLIAESNSWPSAGCFHVGPAIADNGDVAFFAKTEQGKTGVWRGQPGSLNEQLREGTAAPDPLSDRQASGVGDYACNGSADNETQLPLLSSTNEITLHFDTVTEDDPNGFISGIVRERVGSLGMIAIQADFAPGPGELYWGRLYDIQNTPRDVGINAAGTVVFYAPIVDAASNAYTGIFLAEGENPEAVAITQVDVAPCVSPLSTFQVLGHPSIGGPHVVFHGESGAPAATEGIWRYSSNIITCVALAGSPVEGALVEGSVIGSILSANVFNGILVNHLGHTLFACELRDPSGATLGHAVIFTPRDGEPQVVFQDGQLFGGYELTVQSKGLLLGPSGEVAVLAHAREASGRISELLLGWTIQDGLYEVLGPEVTVSWPDGGVADFALGFPFGPQVPLGLWYGGGDDGRRRAISDDGTLVIRAYARVERDPDRYEDAILAADLRPQNIPCPADFNADGFVTGDDFDGYVAAFESGDPSADFNNDGFISGDDFDLFVAAFEAGC